MKTHERNVLMWLVNWGWWPDLVLVAIILAALFSFGCGLLKSPTAPDEPELHPNEILITEHTQCYADYFRLGKITCSFFEEEWLVDCSDDYGNDDNGDPEMCQVSGTAKPGTRHARYYGPWVRSRTINATGSSVLEATAAHEVCHMVGTWSERAAKKCTEIAWDRAKCHEGGFQPVGLGRHVIVRYE